MKNLKLIKKIIKEDMKVSFQDLYSIFEESFNGLFIEIKWQYPYES